MKKRLALLFPLLCAAAMAGNYAVVETSTGHVTNIIVWDGSTPIPTPEGCTLRPAVAGDVIYQPPAPPAPTQAEVLTARATALLAEDGSNLRDDVARFLAQVSALAAAGVTLPEPLTFRELMAAIEANWPADPGQAAAAGLKLRTAWDDVVYHAGTLREADELFPFLVQQVGQ